MNSLLSGKNILLGVSGSIAAYKVAGWVRALREAGAAVTVVMTEAGARFVAPLTFAALAGRRVYTDMFDPHEAENIPHISLARDHDLILIAPATARTIARLAHGLAEDLLSTVVLAARIPVLVCPAMNSRMYSHPATQSNLARIREYGYRIIEPASGLLACGDEGQGRLAEWDEVHEAVLRAFSPQDLAGCSVLISAGPTCEPLDPARYLSNRASGKMGFALARTAKRRGAEVILVAGPNSLRTVPGVETVQVTTAAEMREAIMARHENVSVVVMAAAVSDYRPAEISGHKIKKGEAALSLGLAANQDILRELGEKRGSGNWPLLAGFAAESRDHLAEGRRKLSEKNLDLIVINDIAGQDRGFAADTNQVILLDRSGALQELPLLSKEETADRIWDKIVTLRNK